MSTKEYYEAAKLLDSLLPEYKKVSEMVSDPEDTQWYKGACANGDIGIMPNIGTWERCKDAQGRTVVYKKPFEIRYSLAEARKAVAERRISVREIGDDRKDLGIGF